jgi:hypothetical protein
MKMSVGYPLEKGGEKDATWGIARGEWAEKRQEPMTPASFKPTLG